MKISNTAVIHHCLQVHKNGRTSFVPLSGPPSESLLKRYEDKGIRATYQVDYTYQIGDAE